MSRFTHEDDDRFTPDQVQRYLDLCYKSATDLIRGGGFGARSVAGLLVGYAYALLRGVGDDDAEAQAGVRAALASAPSGYDASPRGQREKGHGGTS